MSFATDPRMGRSCCLVRRGAAQPTRDERRPSGTGSGRALTVSADPRIGSEFLGYRIDELLGRGGMGVVYRGYDLRLKRNVALKLIAPELSADARFRELFLAETELAASLEHPNVVPVHDAGEMDGQLYLAMRYVEGSDLKTLIARRGRTRAAACTRAVRTGRSCARRGTCARTRPP